MTDESRLDIELNKTLNHLVRQAADELDIDVPIMRVRVSGGRLELFLYGGARASWPIPQPVAASPAVVTDTALADMSYGQLRQLAAALKIEGRSKLKKGDLVRLIAQARKEV